MDSQLIIDAQKKNSNQKNQKNNDNHSLLINLASQNRLQQLLYMLKQSTVIKKSEQQNSASISLPISKDMTSSLILSLQKGLELFDQQKNEDLYQKYTTHLDTLLDIAAYLFNQSLQADDITFISMILQRHRNIGQLKYCLTVYRQNFSHLISLNFDSVSILKYLSVCGIFSLLLAEANKCSLDTIEIMRSYSSYERKAYFDLSNKIESAQQKQNITEFITKLRKKVISQVIVQLQKCKLKQFKQKNYLSPTEQKKAIMDLLNLLFLPLANYSSQQVCTISEQQTQLKEVYTNYKLIQNMKIDIPSSFIFHQNYYHIKNTFTNAYCLEVLSEILIHQLPNLPDKIQSGSINQGLQNQFCSKKRVYSYTIINDLLYYFLDLIKHTTIKNLAFLGGNHTWIDTIRVISIYLGLSLEPKTELYSQITAFLNQLPNFTMSQQQLIWRNIILQFQKQEQTENIFNYKCFLYSQYRKFLTPKFYKKLTQSQICRLISNSQKLTLAQIKSRKQKHGNLNFLTHLFTTIYYWIKMFEKYESKLQMRHHLLNNWQQILQICREIQKQLRTRLDCTQNQKERAQLTICLFRLEELTV